MNDALRDRPDMCPGAIQVHRAADGGLARVRLPGGHVTVAQWTAVADAAAELGNALLELTSRGNVQVRGLPAGAEAELGTRLAEAGLLPSTSHERVRNILASPLSGRDGRGLVDVRPLVAELDRRLCATPALAELSGRFLFTLDDGRGDVVGLRGDVGVIPVTADQVLLPLSGSDHSLCTTLDAAVDGMLAVAAAFMAERAAQGSTAWRLADLTDGPRRILARLTHPALRWTEPAGEMFPVATEHPIGVIPQVGGSGDPLAKADGRLMSVAVVAPLGRLTRAQAGALADVARGALIVTPWRGVVVPDVPGAEAHRVLATLSSHGLIVDPASPWHGVTACTGLPGCAKSLADVRADATAWLGPQPRPGTGDGAVPARGRSGDGSTGDAFAPAGATAAPTGLGGLPVHWVGCGRRCGTPGGPHVEVLATGDGYRVTAGEDTWSTVDPGSVIDEARRTA
ncbi:precorrin-3B synthase [Longispora fulva]|uniref:Precorrin-3B synthase n=1 Tax=Longispora fulva TaxID=619741 RepID=A0A8J7GI86_9ACTN|nr:precorrin-3B synthase [Longispora fulva]MBG6137980.1 precorrin-3B synthase [Longispora fulva]GIG60233.1 precorrin-3B synthase [Longispora fulva]